MGAQKSVIPIFMSMEHISLHPFRQDDAHRVTELINSPGVQQYLTLPTPYLLCHAQDFINRCITQHLPHFCVWVNGEPAGCIGLGNSPGGDPSEQMVGYWLGADYHGRGIATRALLQFLPLLPALAPHCRRFVAFTHVDNVASRRVLEKGGFTCAGMITEYQGKQLPFSNAFLYTLSLSEVIDRTFTLKPWQKSDTTTLYNLISPEQITSNLLIPTPYQLHHAQAFIQDCTSKPSCRYAICAGGRIVGGLGAEYTPNEAGGQNIKIGYWLGTDYRGQGYATAAVKLLLQLIPVLMPEHNTIYARVLKHNTPGAGVLQKCGFTCTGEVEYDTGAATPAKVYHFEYGSANV